MHPGEIPCNLYTRILVSNYIPIYVWFICVTLSVMNIHKKKREKKRCFKYAHPGGKEWWTKLIEI